MTLYSKRKRRNEYALDESHAESVIWAEILNDPDNAVLEKLRVLPALYTHTMALRYLYAFDNRECARLLNISEVAPAESTPQSASSSCQADCPHFPDRDPGRHSSHERGGHPHPRPAVLHGDSRNLYRIVFGVEPESARSSRQSSRSMWSPIFPRDFHWTLRGETQAWPFYRIRLRRIILIGISIAPMPQSMLI